MLIRGLIVLLLALNLGAALWWALHTPPAPPATPEPPPGVARLRLVGEAGPAPAAAAPPTVPARECLAVGPFAFAHEMLAVRTRLQPLATQVDERLDYAGTPDGWRVFLPAFATIGQTEAAAARVAEAGFRDIFVVRDGDEAKSLALGLYSREASARERVEALQGAGFAARLEPTGVGAVGYWLDVTVVGAEAAARVREAAGTAQVQARACEGGATS